MTFLSEEFGRIAFPRESSQNRSNAASIAYGRFKAMLPILGITEKTAPGTSLISRKLLFA